MYLGKVVMRLTDCGIVNGVHTVRVEDEDGNTIGFNETFIDAAPPEAPDTVALAEALATLSPAMLETLFALLRNGVKSLDQ